MCECAAGSNIKLYLSIVWSQQKSELLYIYSDSVSLHVIIVCVFFFWHNESNTKRKHKTQAQVPHLLSSSCMTHVPRCLSLSSFSFFSYSTEILNALLPILGYCEIEWEWKMSHKPSRDLGILTSWGAQSRSWLCVENYSPICMCVCLSFFFLWHDYNCDLHQFTLMSLIFTSLILMMLLILIYDHM